MLVAPIAVYVDELATASAERETFVSSCAAVTWSIDSPSSSAAIIRTAVGDPCPISAQPWNSVTVLSGLTWSHESIWVGSGGPGTAPMWRDEVAPGLFAASAAGASERPATTVPLCLRNVLRESSLIRHPPLPSRRRPA